MNENDGMLCIRDLPDALFEQILGARREILEIIDNMTIGAQLTILEMLLAQTIYFSGMGKEDREAAAIAMSKNLIYNFREWDKIL